MPIEHPDFEGDVEILGDVDSPLGDADPIDDKGDGLTSFNLNQTKPDPRRHWRLVPADTLNRTQRATPSEIRGEIAGYRSTIPIPYGTVRIPGKITAIYHQSGFYYFVFAVCVGPVTDINKCFWNGVEVTMSAIANGQYDGDLPESGDINIYDGTQDYVDPKLALVNISGFDGYTSTHEGYCYAAVQITSTLVEQLPRLEVELDGLAVPGAGGSGSAFSTNPARILADLLSNTDYGAGQTMDWDSVDDAADYCDETLDGEKRFEMAMALQRPRTLPEWVGVISAYGSIYVDGTGSSVKFIVDKPRDSVATFGPGRIIQGSTSWSKNMGTRHPDDVVVEWYDVSTGQTKLAYAIGNLSTPLEEFIRMPGFTTHSQAKRFAIQRLNQIRLRDLTYTVDVSNEGIELTIGDRIQLTDERWRIANKPFVVVGITIPSEGIYRLSLIEYQSNAYSDSVETAPVTDDYGLPHPSEIVPPTPARPTVQKIQSTSGDRIIQISVAPSASDVVSCRFDGEWSNNSDFSSVTGIFNTGTPLFGDDEDAPAQPVGGPFDIVLNQTTTQTYMRVRARVYSVWGTESEQGNWSDTITF